MIREAMEKVQELAQKGFEPREIAVGGRMGLLLPDGGIEWDTPVYPATVEFSTLQSLADFINGGFNAAYLQGKPFVVIDSPTSVYFASEAAPPYSKRPTLAKATPWLPDQFRFGSWLDPETFIINMQSKFVRAAGDWTVVVDACAGLKADEGANYSDDGVAQKITVQKGVSLKTQKPLPNPVLLAPFRTFPEVAQPISPFVLRASDGNNGPVLGLFEADGGAWKIVAVERIKAWLMKHIDGITILA